MPATACVSRHAWLLQTNASSALSVVHEVHSHCDVAVSESIVVEWVESEAVAKRSNPLRWIKIPA